MGIDLLYFGRLRDDFGRDTERVDPPSHVLTVEDLLAWLRDKGEPYAGALADSARIRAAVDQEPSGPADSFFGAREVALMPPMGAL